MAIMDISKLNEKQINELIENRWKSSSSVWDIIESTYKRNTAIYENKSNWLSNIPYIRQQWIIQANRIFVNMESVINSLIANPPGINILPARQTPESQEFASKLENYFRKKYLDLNLKEILRKGYRNLYFSRLMVIKAFWNPLLGHSGDFDFRTIDSRNIRFGKYATKEQDTEFAIEEIEDNLCAIIERFPEKEEELMKKYGFNNKEDLYVKNPDVKYKEAWIGGEYVIFKLDNIILGIEKNPYWDWDGILITKKEEQQLEQANFQQRRDILQPIKLEQEQRKAQSTLPPLEDSERIEYKTYLFNYFDQPRKPYIFATVFNNENSPIGRTDMITLSADLQRGIDKRKMDIDQNCEMVNGILKVDASVMGKSDAQRMRFETKGIIWGKGVKDGVTREVGQGLPQMVFEDMIDSRSEIDNIMAASSAFRGEREGQETKAGRLALIQQSYLRLNELVQVGDYVVKEIFDWGMQLAKTRYTEYHYAKWIGQNDAQQIIELIQDDFETGSEVTIVAGKSLPVDDEWRFEQAQNDFEKGALGLSDYLRISKYDDSKDIAKNTVTWQMNKPISVGMTPEEVAQIAPPQQEEKPPNVSINYSDLTPDAQVQLLAKIGIEANPQMIIAEKMAEHKKGQVEMGMKVEAQKHSQKMAELLNNKTNNELNKET